ncbi:hypothetical protein BURMUCGD2M_4320 [Burkholderia multivorans CGD2M]|uniref:Uncharacterized protein n=1 Tax=Burkholderia multivorans CGD2 TaxID=513052 RepID=B9BGW2_9BURK|nr:hypothetical protein BURMUCGD2_4331 [Burkholderia multivorans CGD2]EEE14878.1 hypothetical protein BURMUCGD2M_4320 [Burkholderia multivorans CGD2M]
MYVQRREAEQGKTHDRVPPSLHFVLQNLHRSAFRSAFCAGIGRPSDSAGIAAL